jgi:uncharacterized protein (TIGR03067 family)
MGDDLGQLQGTWYIVTLEIEGAKLVSSAYAGAHIIIDGSKFTSIAMGAKYSGTIELDPSTDPKTFRMKFLDGPEKGNTNFGIYDLVGDTWRFCLSMTGGPAPKEFATTPNSGQALEVLNREK